MIVTNIKDCNQTPSLLVKMIKGSNIPLSISFFFSLNFSCSVVLQKPFPPNESTRYKLAQNPLLKTKLACQNKNNPKKYFTAGKTKRREGAVLFPSPQKVENRRQPEWKDQCPCWWVACGPDHTDTCDYWCSYCKNGFLKSILNKKVCFALWSQVACTSGHHMLLWRKARRYIFLQVPTCHFFLNHIYNLWGIRDYISVLVSDCPYKYWSVTWTHWAPLGNTRQWTATDSELDGGPYLISKALFHSLNSFKFSQYRNNVATTSTSQTFYITGKQGAKICLI